MIFDYTGILFPYPEIGKRLDEIADIVHLPQDESTGVEANAINSTIRFNSTYLELVDKTFYERGYISFFSSICFVLFCFVTSFLIYASFKDLFFKVFEPLNFITSIFLALICMPLAYLMYRFGLKKDTFAYTHYPIRFNRKNKKVYVFRPDGTTDQYFWSDLYVALMVNNPKKLRADKAIYDIRFNRLDEKGIIQEAFSLPFCSDNFNDWQLNFSAQWEYVRRYMQDENIAESHAAVDQLLPISKQRESIFYSTKIVWGAFSRNGLKDFKEVQTDTGVAYKVNPEKTRNTDFYLAPFKGLAFNVIIMMFIGRVQVAKLAKRPVWPKWVEEECQVDADDPYDLDRHPKPKAARPPFSFARVIVYGITAVLAYLNLYATLWCFDLIAMGKDADISLHGLLEFWQWFG